MAAKKLLEMGIIPLQELNIILVLTSIEAREGFTRVVLLLEEVYS
jgi:hypothetical protein